MDVEDAGKGARPGEPLAGSKPAGAHVRRDGSGDLPDDRRGVAAIDGEGQGPGTHRHIDNV
jgi:hypothetical protein